MEKIATLMDFYSSLNAFLSPELVGARKLADFCPIKTFLTYLHSYSFKAGVACSQPEVFQSSNVEDFNLEN